MKKTLLIAGAAALAFTAPAFAKPGKGHGHGNSHGYGDKKGHDWDDGRGDGRYGYYGRYGYGAGGCPPGLDKKDNGCRPPGQVKKSYKVGQRFPYRYGYRWRYSDIPYDIRRRYGFDARDRYYYGDGYLYRVDPRTMLIEQAVLAARYR